MATERIYTETLLTGLSFDMIRVEEGRFIVGGIDEGAYDDGKSLYQAEVSSFYMGKYPVTQALWEEVMGNNPSFFRGCPDCPVEYVSWYDCQDFLKKLNQRTGQSYRLPTETEWEFAARGGNRSKGYSYAGSNDLDEVGWYKNNSRGKTQPVGQKKPNELGLYDMSGNVWEWIAELENRVGVVRGGSRYNIHLNARVSYRHYYLPYDRGTFIGFRLALSIQ